LGGGTIGAYEFVVMDTGLNVLVTEKRALSESGIAYIGSPLPGSGEGGGD
jgi:hypothetical protein